MRDFGSVVAGGGGTVDTWAPYGRPAARRKRRIGLLAVTLASLGWIMAAAFGPAVAQPAERPMRIVALGDSLTAGYGLPASASFPSRLQAALRARGHNVVIINAGASGDTAAGALDRLDWSVPVGTDGVIVAIGANDMLRGIEPMSTRIAIEGIVRRLRERGIEVLVAGMLSSPNLGPEYAQAYNVIFPEVASRYGAVFHPFLLDGVALDPRFNQPDGIHPNAAGVDIMVAAILSRVETLIQRIRRGR